MHGEAGPAAHRPTIALAETCRVVGSDVPLWPLHRRRLAEGGCGEGILVEIERSLASAIAAYEGERTSRLRAHVQIWPDGRLTVEIERRLSSLDVVRGPLIAPVQAAALGPFPTPPPGGAKPADRSWWDAAALEARRAGAHQAIVLDDDGFVLDGSSASVWIVVGCRILTPPAPPAVSGVARRFVLSRAQPEGVTVAAVPVRWTDVETADEVFLTNAFGGAVAVRDRSGPLTQAVQRMFADAWPRQNDDGHTQGECQRTEEQ